MSEKQSLVVVGDHRPVAVETSPHSSLAFTVVPQAATRGRQNTNDYDYLVMTTALPTVGCFANGNSEK